MTLTADQRRTVEALRLDIEATLSPADAEVLASDLDRHASDIARQFEWAQHDERAFADELVEDVQQRIHDEFIDVSWPHCPRHPNHPLWLQSGEWWCTSGDARIAALGALSRLVR